MADTSSSEAPLEAVADTVGERTTEAFEILGNDTRLAILLALWVAKDPQPPVTESPEPGLPFSELYDRVGCDDTGNFNYHLDKLVGPFVRETDEGYKLTWSADQVLSAVFAGILTDHSSLEGEPIGSECYRCGAPVVIDYVGGTLVERCTDCEGAAQRPDGPTGFLAGRYQPPVGLRNRSPQEFHRAGGTWNRYRVQSLMDGVCPDCSGTVTSAIHCCEDHTTDDGAVCERCGTIFEVMSCYVCDVCKTSWITTGYAPIITEMPVKVFFYEHGLNLEALLDDPSAGRFRKAVEQVHVRSEDPLEVEVTVELDGDRLIVTIDDEARVIDVTEDDRDPA